MRPNVLAVGNTQYWTINIYDTSGALVDADSTPTVAIRKNGVATADVVTITKRAATTGIYDCSFNPGSDTQNDTFGVEESATISSSVFVNSWEFSVVGKTPVNFDVVSVDIPTPAHDRSRCFRNSQRTYIARSSRTLVISRTGLASFTTPVRRLQKRK